MSIGCPDCEERALRAEKQRSREAQLPHAKARVVKLIVEAMSPPVDLSGMETDLVDVAIKAVKGAR